MLSLFVIYFLVILILLYLYLNERLNYWKHKGVPFISADIFTAVKTQFYDPVPVFEHYARIYEQLSDYEYGGSFKYFKPQFIIREPELIKHVLNKDFQHFQDRGSTTYDEYDPISWHIFSVPGDLWRGLRIRLTPTFTSGKMKFMYGMIQECAEEYQQSLRKLADAGAQIDFKEKSAGYTMEVICSTAFGLKTNSILNPDSEFKEIGRLIFENRFRFKLKGIINEWLPFLKPYIRFSGTNRRVKKFFNTTVRETVQYRKQTGSTRNDFLQLLINLGEEVDAEDTNDGKERHILRKENIVEMNHELMTAQCFVFFIAGFDTSSLVLSMTLLELAVNSEIQEKLHKEIDEYVEEYGGKITYEMLKSMPYLHKVVQETMRKYPVLQFLSRVCTKTYTVPGSNITIEKGTEVIIPLSGIHRDPKYYPNPMKYDPERFSAEEIQKRHSFAYLPFGEGPRNCIGSRFGLLSVKLGIVHLLQQYDFHTTPNTIYPVKFGWKQIITSCDHAVLLRCTLRNRS